MNVKKISKYIFPILFVLCFIAFTIIIYNYEQRLNRMNEENSILKKTREELSERIYKYTVLSNTSSGFLDYLIDEGINRNNTHSLDRFLNHSYSIKSDYGEIKVSVIKRNKFLIIHIGDSRDRGIQHYYNYFIKNNVITTENSGRGGVYKLIIADQKYTQMRMGNKNAEFYYAEVKNEMINLIKKVSSQNDNDFFREILKAID